MTAPLDWRKIERALEGWARTVNRPILQRNGGTGDMTAFPEEPDDGDRSFSFEPINLTALAKHLADELGGTT